MGRYRPACDKKEASIFFGLYYARVTGMMAKVVSFARIAYTPDRYISGE
jgi:hypothetical protein